MRARCLQELYTYISCPNAEVEAASLYTSPLARKVAAEYHDFLVFLGQQSGYTHNGQPLSLEDVYKVYDPLWAEYCHPNEHKLPTWANKTVIERTIQLYFIVEAMMYSTPVLRRLRAGPLYADILDRMEERAAGRRDGGSRRQRLAAFLVCARKIWHLEREKLYAYSAHDTAISAALTGLGIPPAHFPAYATATFIELHQSGASDFFVRVCARS